MVLWDCNLATSQSGMLSLLYIAFFQMKTTIKRRRELKARVQLLFKQSSECHQFRPYQFHCLITQCQIPNRYQITANKPSSFYQPSNNALNALSMSNKSDLDTKRCKSPNTSTSISFLNRHTDPKYIFNQVNLQKFLHHKHITDIKKYGIFGK